MQLRAIHRILSVHGFEFGHRVFQEALEFHGIMLATGAVGTTTEILDIQMVQKIMPKINGAQRRVEQLLLDLQKYCQGVKGAGATLGEGVEDLVPAGSQYPLTQAKLGRMLTLLRANHFVAFTD